MSEQGDPPFGYKYMACRHCKKPMLVGVRKRKAPSHMECGVKAMHENMNQIQAKSGPYYDKWKTGQIKYLEELGGGSAPPSDRG